MANEEKTFLIRIKAKADEFAKGFKTAVNIGRAQLKRLQDQVFSLKSAFVALGGTLLAKSFIGTASEFEQFRLQLETLEGSSAKARDSFDWIKTFAKDTPYELNDITDAFIRLKAYGIDPTDGTMRTLGDTAAAMGKTLGEAVEALSNAATGEFENLKKFGIKAQVEGDKVLFRYQKNGQELVATADKNSQSMIQSTIKAIWNDRYAGGMDKLSKGWTGIWSNIADTWTQIQSNIMDGGLFNYLKAISSVILDEMGGALKSSKEHAVEWSNVIIAGIESTIRGAAQLANSFRGFQIIFKTLEVSWQGFKTLVLTGAASIEGAVRDIRSFLGEKISGKGPLQLWAEDAQQELQKTNKEWTALMDELANSEQPGQIAERIIGRIRDKFNAMTAAAKESKQASSEASGAAAAGTNNQLTATDALIQSLEHELALMKLSDKERFVEQQMRKLSTGATEEQRQKVRALADEMYVLQKAGKDATEELINAVHGWGNDFTNTFADSIQSGKFAFKDLADSIIRDLLRIATQKLITDQIVNAATAYFGSFHSGGVVGSGGGMRSVSPMVFAGAPRYHTGGIAGLRPREIPAVLNYGEEVLTENDPRHIKNVGKGGGMAVDVRIHNEGSNAMQVTRSQPSFDGSRMILDVFLSDLSRGGQMDAALQRQYGLTRKV